MSNGDDPKNASETPTYLRFGRRKIPMPKTKFMRTVLGTSIIVWGIIPVPPGLAVVPVGMGVLSVDYPKMRKRRRKLLVWSGRRYQRWTRK
jgi:hypothetical protein